MLFLYNFSQLFELFTFDGYFFENKSLNLQSDIIFKKKEIYNMKKFTILFTMLVAMATTAIADNIQPSTLTSNPEHRYTMRNDAENPYYANSNTAPTQTEANYGHFAFYAVDNVTNAYYIYSVKANKYLSYDKADSDSNGMNKVTLVDRKEDANYFYIEKCQSYSLFYQLRPYNNSGVASKYLNWFGGVDNNKFYHYDAGTLGLWEDSGSADRGSRFLFTEVQSTVPSRTITVTTDSEDCVVKANNTVGGVTAEGEIALTAEPAFGYNFVEWRLGDEVVSTNANYTDNTDGDRTYVAVFERITDADELYASIGKPTFNKAEGATGTTIINSVKFNNSALHINNYTTNSSNRITEVLEVEAGMTYSLDLKYEMHWGDLAIFQIDKNGYNKEFGYYTCSWRPGGGDPVTILKDENRDLICSELGLTSIDELTYTETSGTKSLNIPYRITINENLTHGDFVIIRAMITTENALYSGMSFNEGSCLDIILKVAEIDYRQQLEDVFTVLANYENNNMIGTKIGQYSTTHDHIALLNEVGFLLYATDNPDVNEYKTKIIEVQNVINSLTLNLPTANNYFTVAYDYGENVGVLYMQGIPTEQVKYGQNSYAAKFSNETNAASIWLYYDGALYSYTAGCCIKELDNDRGLQAVGVKQTATFSISTRDKNKYNINCGAYIHANVTDSNYYSDHCGENSCIQHDLILEEVTTLPVTIGDALYATFYAPVAVGVPEGVNAYYLAADGIKNNIAKLTDIGDIIPANTGVILEATQAGIYNFNITETDLTVTNLLKGTVAAKYIEEESYVLSKPNDKELGLYKAQMKDVGTATTSGKGFKNNSHKVYLPENELSSVAQGSNGFRIVFGGTTAIEEIEASVKDENKNEIYDLTGRKLEGFNGTGVYIVNGKKVVR